MTAVESLADFIIPKVAVNPAALVRMCKHGSYHDDCCSYERIRELEAELEKMPYELGRQWGRAERAEARVKELEAVLKRVTDPKWLANASDYLLQKPLHARDERGYPRP